MQSIQHQALCGFRVGPDCRDRAAVLTQEACRARECAAECVAVECSAQHTGLTYGLFFDNLFSLLSFESQKNIILASRVILSCGL